MTGRSKLLILGLVAAGIVTALVLRQHDNDDAPTAALVSAGPQAAATTVATGVNTPAMTSRPRLIELGSSKCASCKAMHEELGELRKECPDGLEIEIIDVFRDEAKAKPFDVDVIPTQVFLDGDGKEIDRHIGFLARADIRERFAKVGLVCP